MSNTTIMRISLNDIVYEVEHEGSRVLTVTVRATDGGDLGQWPILNLDQVRGLIGPESSNGHKATPLKTAPKASAKPAKAVKATEPTEGGTETKKYRQLGSAEYPEEAVIEAYAQVRTVTGVADALDVPRHTAQGWIKRLREQGKIATN